MTDDPQADLVRIVPASLAIPTHEGRTDDDWERNPAEEAAEQEASEAKLAHDVDQLMAEEGRRRTDGPDQDEPPPEQDPMNWKEYETDGEVTPAGVSAMIRRNVIEAADRWIDAGAETLGWANVDRTIDETVRLDMKALAQQLSVLRARLDGAPTVAKQYPGGPLVPGRPSEGG